MNQLYNLGNEVITTSWKFVTAYQNNRGFA